MKRAGFENFPARLYVYVHTQRENRCVFFASLYLSNCDVIGFRPKVCYCNTFTEKKKKRKKCCCCSQRFYACTYAVVKLQRNE